MNNIFYLDDDNNFVDEEKATKIIYEEYDENNNLIKETTFIESPSLENEDESEEALREKIQNEYGIKK